MLALTEGAKVNAFGPIGWFLLPKDEKEEKVFISGGIGVTPFHSLLTTLHEEKLEVPITLLATFSKAEDAVFYDVLMEVSKNNSQIRSVYLYSRITEAIVKQYVLDIQKPVYYIVGSEEMVAETKALLLALGVDAEKIQTEDFTGY